MNPDYDVLIVGAGISGIGAAAHLHRKQPDRTYAILEGREDIGGTWDVFRYPGIRSDSDLHTFCYDFKPWTADESIAAGPAILRYLRETVGAYDIASNIRFGHKVREARWSSAERRWTVVAERGEGDAVELTARWLFCAGGYYRYDGGHAPHFEGQESFAGQIVHPQSWPEDLDWAGKKVVVIGSGATAVTLVPALAESAAGVTMLQRTPTYILSVPSVDPVHALARRLLGEVRAHRFARWKNIRLDRLIFGGSRRFPRRVRALVRSHNRKELPEGYAVDTHFNPPYDPWDQRMCAAQDGDFFAAIRDGRADVVTDRIARFVADGIELESGERLDADVVVTATGLEMVPFAGISYAIDGEPVELSGTVTYKGMMLSRMPNFIYALGYTNASWTLKVDLICEHFCRLLDLMDERGYEVATPEAPDPREPTSPLVGLGAGYVQRAVDRFPRQGSVEPWLLKQDYLYDRKLLREGPVGDHLELARSRAAEPFKRRDGFGGKAALAKEAKLPPGPRWLPKAIGGYAVLLNHRPTLDRLRRRYGDAFTLNLPILGRTVVVSSPELVKQMYTASPEVLRTAEGSPLGEMLGPGSLFALDGKPHLRERKLLLPPFHGNRMQSYEGIIEEEAVRELAGWEEGVAFPTLESFMRITLNAILRTVFGAEGAEQRRLVELLPEMVSLGSVLTLATWLRPDLGARSPGGRYRRLRAEYDTVIGSLIDDALRDPGFEERTDILALLLSAHYDDGSAMSRSAIADELLTLLAAGHETTATSLAWGVERLSRHPGLLGRLEAEAEGDDKDLRVATINEIQRTRPVITLTDRSVYADHFEIGEWTVPKGHRIAAPAPLIHEDPRFFERPLEFDPDRFLERPPETYTWIPFGGGTRRCVGAAFAQMEMNVVLRTLLREFALQPTTAPAEKWKPRGIAFAPAAGGVVTVRRRAARPEVAAATRIAEPA